MTRTRATYVVPEKRDVQQIEFKTEAEAKAARAKIEAGTKFEDTGRRSAASSRRRSRWAPWPRTNCPMPTAPRRSSRCR